MVNLGPTYRRPRSERQFKKTQRPASGNFGAWNARVVSAVVATTVVTVTFDRYVLLRDPITGFSTDIGGTELSAVQLNPRSIAVTFDTDQTGATVLNMPNMTNAVRTRDGGYAVSPTFPAT